MENVLEVKAFKMSDLAYPEPVGSFKGLASVYNVVDFQNDVVLPGAFGNVSKTKILYQHDPTEPIGWGTLEDTPEALRIAEGQLAMDLPKAHDTWVRMKAGLVDGLSIGYEPKKVRVRKDGVRELVEVKLHEVSLVTFPANPLSRVSSLKGLVESFAARLEAQDHKVDPQDFKESLESLKSLLTRLTTETVESAESKRVVKRDGKWCVVTADGSATIACHDTEEQALAQLRAIEANKAALAELSETFGVITA